MRTLLARDDHRLGGNRRERARGDDTDTAAGAGRLPRLLRRPGQALAVPHRSRSSASLAQADTARSGRRVTLPRVGSATDPARLRAGARPRPGPLRRRRIHPLGRSDNGRDGLPSHRRACGRHGLGRRQGAAAHAPIVLGAAGRPRPAARRRIPAARLLRRERPPLHRDAVRARLPHHPARVPGRRTACSCGQRHPGATASRSTVARSRTRSCSGSTSFQRRSEISPRKLRGFSFTGLLNETPPAHRFPLAPSTERN